MGAAGYTTWDKGGDFITALAANRQQLQQFLAAHNDGERQQMAEGLAQYLSDAIGRDPNDLPAGVSETLDDFRTGKTGGNKITAILKGVKNDFYNLFEKHPNVMLTTGGMVGLGGGLSLLKHYGMDQGTTGGKITSIGNMIFQTEKAVTLSTGPFRKKQDAYDTSLSGQLAAALNGEVPAGGSVPEGMDAHSPEGKMVAASSKSLSDVFQHMVKHREMLIGNILVAGETFQSGGFAANAFFDKKHINSISRAQHKAEVRTAKGGIVNALSNTLLMGLTYYNQYIDPKLRELDKTSPNYAKERAKIWDEAPKTHMFKAGRACAMLIDALPEKTRAIIPNIAIGCSFLPLAGMMMEGLKSGKDGGMAPLQFFGSLAVMANVLLNYTAITKRSAEHKVLAPEEITRFTDLIGDAAQLARDETSPPAEESVASLKQVILAQSFVAPEHEGLVEKNLHRCFNLPFIEVRDHSRRMPASEQPALLAQSHTVVQAVKILGAAQADIRKDGITLAFSRLPDPTQQAIDALQALAARGSHTVKALGGFDKKHAADGTWQLQLQPRGLPALVQAAEALAAPENHNLDFQQQVELVQKTLSQTPAKATSHAAVHQHREQPSGQQR